jgi:hypothetical protein
MLASWKSQHRSSTDPALRQSLPYFVQMLPFHLYSVLRNKIDRKNNEILYEMEEWRDIVGYEKLYQVSSHGNVRSLPKRTSKGRILKPSITHNGYYRICLSKDNTKKNRFVHCLVADAFLQNPDNKPQIDHINRNKLDNTISNLRWANASENGLNREFQLGESGHKHIKVRSGNYRVEFKRINDYVSATFTKLEDALSFRDNFLASH